MAKKKAVVSKTPKSAKSAKSVAPAKQKSGRTKPITEKTAPRAGKRKRAKPTTDQASGPYTAEAVDGGWVAPEWLRMDEDDEVGFRYPADITGVAGTGRSAKKSSRVGFWQRLRDWLFL